MAPPLGARCLFPRPSRRSDGQVSSVLWDGPRPAGTRKDSFFRYLAALKRCFFGPRCMIAEGPQANGQCDSGRAIRHGIGEIPEKPLACLHAFWYKYIGCKV
jgi:hypothetical protein